MSSAESKFLSAGSLNFSMAAFASDPAALAGNNNMPFAHLWLGLDQIPMEISSFSSLIY